MENHKVLIIAEAGVNHNGDLTLAKKLIDIAANAGADIVKFQTFKSENLVTATASMADYQIENTQKVETQFEMLKRLELKVEDYIELQNYCHQKAIRFLSTGFDLESLEFLKTLKMGLWKIPSGEITNLPYLEFIGKQGEPVILSTGMATIEEVEEAMKILIDAGLSLDKITVLHCNTDYPTPFNDVNLYAMQTIEHRLKVKVGYSDHTLGVEVSVAAVALGAVVIEKHFTIDQNLPGPDHKASLNPHELDLLVKSIRNIELALGSRDKKPSEGENKNRNVARKSIVASRDINKGEVFSLLNLTVKRPGYGISPMKINQFYGKVSDRNYKKDELINE